MDDLQLRRTGFPARMLAVAIGFLLVAMLAWSLATTAIGSRDGRSPGMTWDGTSASPVGVTWDGTNPAGVTWDGNNASPAGVTWDGNNASPAGVTWDAPVPLPAGVTWD